MKIKNSIKNLICAVVFILILFLIAVVAIFTNFSIKSKILIGFIALLLFNISTYLFVKWNKRKLQTVIMAFFSLVLTAAIICTSFFWAALINTIYNYDGKFTADRENLSANKKIDIGIINIALFGVDTRKEGSFEGRSDSIMILSLDTKEKEIKLISIMRDSFVPIEKSDGTVYNKINTAFSSGGPSLAVKTLNKNFDLDITEYATVNFFGLREIIDAVGGIDVPLTEQEVGTGKNTLNRSIDAKAATFNVPTKDNYIFESGVQHLNGLQAVAYTSLRHIPNYWGTDNDFGRTDRQRYVMQQLLNKALSLKIAEYPKLITALLPYLKTSLGPDKILEIATLMLSSKPTFNQTRMPQLSYTMSSPTNKYGAILYYDLDFATKLIHSYIYKDIPFDQYIKENGIEKNDWYSLIKK